MPVCGGLDPEGAHLAALRRVADIAGAHMVEVGCGDGRLTLGIAERAASVLAFARKSGSFRPTQCRASRRSKTSVSCGSAAGYAASAASTP